MNVVNTSYLSHSPLLSCHPHPAYKAVSPYATSAVSLAMTIPHCVPFEAAHHKVLPVPHDCVHSSSIQDQRCVTIRYRTCQGLRRSRWWRLLVPVAPIQVIDRSRGHGFCARSCGWLTNPAKTKTRMFRNMLQLRYNNYMTLIANCIVKWFAKHSRVLENMLKQSIGSVTKFSWILTSIWMLYIIMIFLNYTIYLTIHFTIIV